MFSLKVPRIACLALSTSLLPLFAAHAQKLEYSSRHREHTHEVAQTLTGPTALTARLGSQRSALSVAVAQFHRGGAPDLVTGYATAGGGGALLLQRGSMEATAPSSAESMAKIATDEDIPAFAETAAAIELPLRPDFLLAQDPHGSGHADLLAGQRGLNSLVTLGGSATGTFSAPVQFGLRGGLTALSTWRTRDNQLLIVAAVKTPQGSGLQLLQQDGTERAFIALSAPATAINSAPVNRGVLYDLLLVAGGEALVLDGDSMLTSAPHFDALPVSRAVAIVPGDFVWDRRSMRQVAILTSDSTLHILARTGLNSADLTPAEIAATHRGMGPQNIDPADVAKITGSPWSVVESLPGIGSGNDSAAILLASRFSVAGGDDLAVLTKGQYFEINHTTTTTAGQRKSTPLVTIDSTPETVTAAVAARVSPDTRLGVITASSSLHPFTSIPSGYHNTYYVNTYSDGINSSSACTSSSGTPACNLRDALDRANADYGSTSSTAPDRILLPSATGTYTLNTLNPSTLGGSSAGPAEDNEGDINYHLNIQTNVNIVGQSGCATNSLGIATSCGTIIDANGANTHDFVFAVDSAPFAANAKSAQPTLHPFAVYMSGFQLRNGVNNDDPQGDASGYAAANGGGLIYDDMDGGILTLSAMVLNGSTSNYSYAGGGGSIVALNSGSGTANFEVDYSSFNSNKTTDSAYGGSTSSPGNTNVTMNYGIHSNNSAGLAGGAIATLTPNTRNPTSVLNGLTINSNSAPSGGGIYWTGSATMTDMTFTSNMANSTGGSGGGGLFIEGDGANEGGFTVSSSTFTNNSTTSSTYGGGAIFSSAPNAFPVNINYNRIHANTSTNANSSGLYVTKVTPYSGYVINANYNWWGCNGDPQVVTTLCDRAFTNDTAASLTTSAFTNLTLTLSSATPAAGATFTATGSLGQPTAGGTKYSIAQDYAYYQTPVTMSINLVSSQTTSGSTFSSSANPAVSNATVTDSGTLNNSGQGLATVTVDGCTIRDTGTSPTCNTSTSYNYTVSAPDLNVTSTHSPTVFRTGQTNTYTLTVANIGTSSTTGTVTVVDTLPGNFTVTSMSGTGWTCNISQVTCTSNQSVSASVTFPPISLVVGVPAADTVGSYTNNVTVSGGGELNTNNDTATDPTQVGDSTSTSVTSVSPNSSTVGGSAVTLTATVTDTTSSSTTPTGSVNFYDNGTLITNVALTGPTATYSYTPENAGSRTITAMFVTSGSSFGPSSDSTGKPLSVAAATVTTASPTNYVAQTGTNTAISVIFGYPGTVAATGTVTMTVSANGSNIALTGITCIAKAKNGAIDAHRNCTGTFNGTGVAVGNYTLTFNQAADTNYAAMSGTANIQVTN